MSDLDRVIALLGSPSIEKQIAAAVVLSELGVKSAKCTDELARLLESDVPLLQRHALDALARLGAKKAAPLVFPLLASHDADVRRSAAAALASVGEAIVPTIRARMTDAGPEERRALDGVLAELGGKEAFAALIAGLAEKEGDAANAAALAFRQRLKGEGARQKRSYLSATTRFLEKKGLSVEAIAAAIKILGFLEDEEATPTLLAYASDAAAPAQVRQEAVIALRFAVGGGKAPARVIDALLDAAESKDRTLAQTALHTLGSLSLPPTATKRLEKLAHHADPARVAFVLALLGRQGTTDATRALLAVVLSGDPRRAELAARELEGKELAAGPLARALIDAKDEARARMLRGALRPLAGKVAPAERAALVTEATRRVDARAPGWDALLDVARDADAGALAEALRTLAARLRKQGEPARASRVLAVLCHEGRATDDDRYAMAALLLAKSAKDTRQAARAADEALAMLGSLLARGFDVGGALKKDRSLAPEDLYYVGFHFAEEEHPLGEDLLSHVEGRGGRSKVARMAKNKLSLVARGGSVARVRGT